MKSYLDTRPGPDYGRYEESLYPPSYSHVECQKEPEPKDSHKLIADPVSNPMNCWEPKTQQDFTDEKAAQAVKLDDPKKAFAATLELLWDNIPALQTAFPDGGTPGAGKQALKQAAVAAYQDKL